MLKFLFFFFWKIIKRLWDNTLDQNNVLGDQLVNIYRKASQLTHKSGFKL